MMYRRQSTNRYLHANASHFHLVPERRTAGAPLRGTADQTAVERVFGIRHTRSLFLGVRTDATRRKLPAADRADFGFRHCYLHPLVAPRHSAHRARWKTLQLRNGIRSDDRVRGLARPEAS